MITLTVVPPLTLPRPMSIATGIAVRRRLVGAFLRVGEARDLGYFQDT